MSSVEWFPVSHLKGVGNIAPVSLQSRLEKKIELGSSLFWDVM
jgi:hypothetical protein